METPWTDTASTNPLLYMGGELGAQLPDVE